MKPLMPASYNNSFCVLTCKSVVSKSLLKYLLLIGLGLVIWSLGIAYERTVERSLDGPVNKSDIYNRLKEWISNDTASEWINQQASLQSDNVSPDNGMIVDAQLTLNQTKKRVEWLSREKWKRTPSATSYPSATYDPQYLLKPKRSCDINGPLILLLVMSRYHAYTERLAIRETWGNENIFQNGTIKTVFLIGASPSSKEWDPKMLQQEQDMYDDLIQAPDIDSNLNDTNKVILGIHWVAENCPTARFTVIANGNYVYVNSFSLVDHADTIFQDNKRHIWCMLKSVGSSEIYRGAHFKKYLETDFFNMTTYPIPHCRGWFMVFTQDLITELYQTAKITPMFERYDVYLTGLVVDVLGTVEMTHLDSMQKLPPYYKSAEFYRDHQWNETIALYDLVRPKELIEIWSHNFNYYLNLLRLSLNNANETDTMT